MSWHNSSGWPQQGWQRKSSVVASVVTWDPVAKAARVTLSGGNLVATQSAGADTEACVLASAPVSVACFWLIRAVTISVLDGAAIGFADATLPTGEYIGQSPHSNGWFGNGAKGHGGSLGYSPSMTGGNAAEVIITCDPASKTGHFYNHAVGWDATGNGDPDLANNIGGLDLSTLTGSIFPVANVYHDGDTFTAGFDGISTAGGYNDTAIAYLLAHGYVRGVQ